MARHNKEYKKIKRTIPFSLTPSFWTTSGKDRDNARARYEYEGEDLERVLLDIEHEDDEEKHAEKSLDLDLKYKKISDIEYEKLVNTLKGEPWVKVINSEYDSSKGASGFALELDWNEDFITMLRNNGYTGATPENIVNSWIDDICKTIAYEDGLLNELDDASSTRNGLTTKIPGRGGLTEYS